MNLVSGLMTNMADVLGTIALILLMRAIFEEMLIRMTSLANITCLWLLLIGITYENKKNYDVFKAYLKLKMILVLPQTLGRRNSVLSRPNQEMGVLN